MEETHNNHRGIWVERRSAESVSGERRAPSCCGKSGRFAGGGANGPSTRRSAHLRESASVRRPVR